MEGKVAAGGNITMNNFSVGWRLPATDLANTLVSGGNMTLSNGGVWGDAWYGASYSGDSTVSYTRGAGVQSGMPINFPVRGTELRELSAQPGGPAGQRHDDVRDVGRHHAAAARIRT